jgi:hypothetical protein
MGQPVLPVPSAAPTLRPTASLVTWLKALFLAFAVVAAIGALLGLVQGVFFPELALEDEPEETDATLMVLGVGCQALLYLPLFVAIIVLFCKFVHRTRWNAEALGSRGMEFTPGWAVGWFFVPLANLFQPYRAVREIYLASDPEAGPHDWSRGSSGTLVGAWWTLWVISNLLGGLLMRVAFTENASLKMLSPWLDVVDGLLDIPLSFLALAVVQAIHRRQKEKAERLTTFD